MRERCGEILEAAERDQLEHFTVDLHALAPTAQYVVEDIRGNYPALDIPYHSRWRHFETGGVDRWQVIKQRLQGRDAHDIARVQFDLTLISVLLDAGAGGEWSFLEAQTGQHYSRSEGLALASLRLFESGAFSASPEDPLRADATRLGEFQQTTLERGFQVRAANPLLGVAGRVALMRGLGAALVKHAAFFGATNPRIGNLYNYLLSLSSDGEIAARDILVTILEALSSIWPGRIVLDGIALGDVWRHRSIERADATTALVPFHKLSQWLTYSLIEPLQEAGLRVVGLDQLTGLAEYRNGGLFVDFEVIRPRDAALLEKHHRAGSEVIVEWRALTVALLDRLAPLVRELLHLDEQAMPLAKILQGGTWSAGRKIAAQRRADGSPPIVVLSDGTVF